MKFGVAESGRVQPVGGGEHWRDEDRVGVAPKCLRLPEPVDLKLPRGMLHENGLGSIKTRDVLSVDQCPRQVSSDEGEVGYESLRCRDFVPMRTRCRPSQKSKEGGTACDLAATPGHQELLLVFAPGSMRVMAYNGPRAPVGHAVEFPSRVWRYSINVMTSD